MTSRASTRNREPVAPDLCPRCGTRVRPQVLGGLCPRCVARGFLHPEFAAAASDAARRPGDLDPDERRMGDYELLEEIGRGGMGVVFRARQVSLGREVALKLLLHGVLAGDAAQARFRIEAEAAAVLRHPNIVVIHEIGEHRGRQFLAMEFVRGLSLAERLRNGPVPVERAVDWILQIADAVHHAHSNGVIHRDLKPSNILVDEHGSARVSDFGLAKRIVGTSTGAADETPTLSGQVLGTPAYLSPEQATARRDLDARGDVYSLGAVLYHLLTGRPPFQGESPAQILRQVTDAEPVAPRLLLPDIPRDLETICLHCLEKDAHRRYATAAALADDLRRFVRGLPIAARPVGTVGRLWRWTRRQPALAAALAGLGLLLLGIAIVSRQSAVRIGGLQQRTLELLYASDMRLAQDSLAKGRHAVVRQLLDRHRPAPGQPDLRGFEWHFLDDQVRSDEIATLGSHAGQAQRAAWSHDGTRLATAATDLRVWDAANQRLVAQWQGSNYFRALGFSADDRFLAAAETTGGLVCYDLHAGTIVARHEGLGAAPFALQWRTADAATVWSTQRRDLWSVRSNSILPEGPLPLSSNRDVLTSGGLLLLGARNPSRMEAWNDTNRVAVFPAEGIPFAFAGSTDGTRFALGEFSGLLAFFTVASPDQPLRLQAHQGLVNVLAFSPDGTRVASGGVDGAIRLWDSTDGRLVAELRGHRKPIWCLAFSPDGSRLASGDGDGKVKLWNPLAEARPRSMPDVKLAVASRNLALWATSSGDSNRVELRRAERPDRVLARVPERSPAGRLVAIADEVLLRIDDQGALALENIDGSPRPPTRLPAAASTDIVLDPGGRFVAYPLAGTSDQALFDLAVPREITRWPHAKGAFRLLDYSADGRRAALGDVTGSLRILRLPDGAPDLEIHAHAQNLYAADFSRDGSLVATAGHDGRVRLWEVASGRAVAEFESTVETYWTVALSPDGTRIAAGTGESGIVLWNVRSTLEVAHFTLAPEAAPVESGLAFGADGSRLIALFGGRLFSWEAPGVAPAGRTARSSARTL